MKKSPRKLALNKEMVRALSAKDTERAVSGQDPLAAFAGQSGARDCLAPAALVQGG